MQSTGTETILAVEDDEAVRATTVELLRDLGYVVLEASNADNALAIVNSGIHIHLLFTDVVMPGKLRSPELVSIARQRLPALKVLFTSGYTQNAIVHAGRLDEGVQLIAKPFTRESLSTKIRRVLSQPNETASMGATSGTEIAPALTPVRASDPADQLRILLVEDEVLIRKTFADTLADMGHKTEVAGTLEEARRYIANGSLDVVITDIGLPDGSGTDLVSELLAHDPSIIVVGATGSELAHDLGSAVRHKVQYLRKPYG